LALLRDEDAYCGDVSDAEATLAVSFRDLRTDMIDLMQIHNLHGIAELMPAFERAKEAGRIRRRSSGSGTTSPEKCVRHHFRRENVSDTVFLVSGTIFSGSEPIFPGNGLHPLRASSRKQVPLFPRKRALTPIFRALTPFSARGPTVYHAGFRVFLSSRGEIDD